MFAGEEIKNGIDKKILDELTAKAKENPRLRCNDMVRGWVVLNIEKGQWHSLKCLESGTVLLEAKDGGESAIISRRYNGSLIA